MTPNAADDDEILRRPRRKKADQGGSAFDIVRDQTFMVTVGSVRRKLTAGEAIQQRTLQEAFQGNRQAMRAVLAMVEEREAALPRAQRLIMKMLFEETNPKNVDDALIILDVAHVIPERVGDEGRPYLELATWVAAYGLSLPRQKPMTKAQVREAREATRDADSLIWPEGVER